MITCQEFLNRYSEYLDGEMELPEAACWRRHIEECVSCRNYDDVLRRGLNLVREIQPVQPSPDFEARLHRRLWELEMEGGPGRRVAGPGVAASLAIAAAVALIAWSPLLWQAGSLQWPAQVVEGAGGGTVGDVAQSDAALEQTSRAGSAPASLEAPVAVTQIAAADPQERTAEVDPVEWVPVRQWSLYSARETRRDTELGLLDDWWAAARARRAAASEHRWFEYGRLVSAGSEPSLFVTHPAFRRRTGLGGHLRTVSAPVLD